jgi:hypothetical protein
MMNTPYGNLSLQVVGWVCWLVCMIPFVVVVGEEVDTPYGNLSLQVGGVGLLACGDWCVGVVVVTIVAWMCRAGLLYITVL